VNHGGHDNKTFYNSNLNDCMINWCVCH